jgi:uncharacterized phage protein (TIGR01671 family)
MNRNFKFRVWSTKENKWMFGYEYPNLGGFSLVGETILLGEFGKYELDRYYNDFAIMQWTGLKDKNGKDIYEGDYLRQKTDACSNKPDMACDYDPLFDRYEIKWDNHRNGYNAFPISALSYYDFCKAIEQLGGLITWPSEDVLQNAHHYEIIGNICENSELSQDVS